jgi:hypothetical protein
LLITRPDGRPGWRGFPGKVFIENDSQIPQGIIGRSEDPVEFRFMNGPTTYWTLTKNVTNFTRPIPTSTPVPTPTPAPEPTPVPATSPTPTSKHYQRQHEGNGLFDDANGQRIWHQVDGKWKWYPANKHHVPVKKALPPDEAPLVKP